MLQLKSLIINQFLSINMCVVYKQIVLIDTFRKRSHASYGLVAGYLLLSQTIIIRFTQLLWIFLAYEASKNRVTLIFQSVFNMIQELLLEIFGFRELFHTFLTHFRITMYKNPFHVINQCLQFHKPKSLIYYYAWYIRDILRQNHSCQKGRKN